MHWVDVKLKIKAFARRLRPASASLRFNKKVFWVILATTLILIWSAGIVSANTQIVQKVYRRLFSPSQNADVTVLATPKFGVGAPTGLILTQIDDFNIDIDWTKGHVGAVPPGTDHSVVNTMIRVKWGTAPNNNTDGYEVYYGTGSTFTDNSIDLTSLTSMPVYRAWSEIIYYDALNNVISNTWEPNGITEEANFMSISWLFMALLLAALALTATMFVTKQAMLGFAAAIFWALFGAYSYTLSHATWDMHFTIAFASLLGMTFFTMFGAWGLREGRKTVGEADMEDTSEEQYIDEVKTDSTGKEIKRRGKRKSEDYEEPDEFDIAANSGRRRK